MKFSNIFLIIFIVVLLNSCAETNLNGIYVCQSKNASFNPSIDAQESINCLFDHLEFKRQQKVDLTKHGITSSYTYKIKNDYVHIYINNGEYVFVKRDSVLEGRDEYLGNYVRTTK